MLKSEGKLIESQGKLGVLITTELNFVTFKYIPCNMLDLRSEGMGIKRTFGNPEEVFFIVCGIGGIYVGCSWISRGIN